MNLQPVLFVCLRFFDPDTSSGLSHVLLPHCLTHNAVQPGDSVSQSLKNRRVTQAGRREEEEEEHSVTPQRENSFSLSSFC